MPSAAFLAAAKAGNRDPVALMAIESVNAVRSEIATQSDWQASKVLNTIDTTSDPGVVTIGNISWAIDPSIGLTASYGTRIKSARGDVKMVWSGSAFVYQITNLTYFVYCSLKDQYGTVKDTGGISFVWGGAIWPGFVISIPAATFIFHNEPLFQPGDRIEINVLTINNSQPDTLDTPPSYWRDYYNTYWTPSWDTSAATLSVTAAAGNLQTKNLDLGQKFATDNMLYVDDIVPDGGSVIYTVRGSDDTITWVDLGPQIDGAILSPYRYYDVSAGLAAGNGALPRIKEIAISNNLMEYFGSHLDQPFAGVRPYLDKKAFGSISSRIELIKAATTGDVSVQMIWTRETSDLIAAGYLKGKMVQLSIGFDGLPSSDFEPLGTYTWHDYSADPNKQTLTVSLRDAFKQFDKIKVPLETWPATDGARTLVPLTWTNINIIQVMIDLFDAVGIPDRMLDRTEFEILRDGIYGSADWQVSRTLSDPEQASSLLNELRVTAGLFLIPQRNGKMTPVIYDATAPEVANLDAKVVQFGTISGGQKDLYTQQLIYYSPKTGVADPSAEKDYDKVLIDIDSQAEIDWKLSARKVWFDKWNSSLAAITALGTRFRSWFATPMLRLSVKNVPLSLMGVQNGELVTVDNLLLPDIAANWPNTAQGRKFLVLNNTFDPSNYTISFDLYDTGQTGAVGPGAVASDIVLSGPDQVWGPSNLFVVSGGTVPFTWATSAGTITDLGNGIISLDVAGLSTGGTLTVNDATGKATHRFTVTPPTVLGGTITGNITNAVIEPPAAVVPADLSATVSTHFDANGWASPQDQIDAGLPIYLQPSADGSVYEEIFDLGQPLPTGTIARVELAYTTLAGTLTIEPTLNMSTDGINYSGTAGQWTADASGQRYLKLKLDITANNNSSLASITSVRIYLTED